MTPIMEATTTAMPARVRGMTKIRKLSSATRSNVSIKRVAPEPCCPNRISDSSPETIHPL